VTSRDRPGDAGRPDDPSDTGRERIHDGGAAEVVRSPEARQGDTPADKLDKLTESGKLNVSPEYRRIVERYLGELSEK
jgi:hypothetical protein